MLSPNIVPVFSWGTTFKQHKYVLHNIGVHFFIADVQKIVHNSQKSEEEFCQK